MVASLLKYQLEHHKLKVATKVYFSRTRMISKDFYIDLSRTMKILDIHWTDDIRLSFALLNYCGVSLEEENGAKTRTRVISLEIHQLS